MIRNQWVKVNLHEDHLMEILFALRIVKKEIGFEDRELYDALEKTLKQLEENTKED